MTASQLRKSITPDTFPPHAQAVRQAYDGLPDGGPRPAWIRGTCPDCQGAIISNAYYAGPGVYIVVWQCWHNLGENPTCEYRRVL